MISGEQFSNEAKALFPSLFRLCMSILNNDQDGQDAIQQGLMKAWAARDTVRPETFRAFLTRIVINECRNIQRHRQRVTPMECIDLEGEACIPEDTGLRSAIDALPEKLRTPLLLYYMENYLEREIAHALGISHVAVRNRLFRARRALQVLMTDREGEAK
jgi:RNA polymerase sigma-70 factor (ECF subfamily)